MRGIGIKQDYAQARQWFEKGTTAGDTDSMYLLGVFYDDGLGIKQDYTQARQWYEKAAAAGNARAMYKLGTLYAEASA